MFWLQVAIAIVVGYLLGSFPTAYLIGRLRKGIDIRQVGSRNMGTMNVFREVGPAEAILVLVVDIFKGVAAMLVARAFDLPWIVQFGAAGSAILGHSFPFFLKFRGGKGGATSMAVLGFTMPLAVPFYLGVTTIVSLVTKNITVGYGLAFACFPMVGRFIYHSWLFVGFSLVLILYLVVMNTVGFKALFIGGLKKGIFLPRFRAFTAEEKVPAAEPRDRDKVS